MLIFIDSNILCSNYRMKGPSFEVAQRVGTIVLGQIVVDEVCNKFKEAIKRSHLLRSMISMTTTALIARIKGLICSRRQAFCRYVSAYGRDFGYIPSYG